MKKLLRTSLMAMLAFAIFCGIDANAQIPNSFKKEIGFGTNTVSGPFGSWGNINPIPFDPMNDPNNVFHFLHVNFSMPPVMELSDLASYIGDGLSAPPSSVMFVYTQNELGTNGTPCQLTEIRIPIVTNGDDTPYDINMRFWQNLGWGTYYPMESPSIKIDIRNVPVSGANTFNRTTPIPVDDVTTANGWQTVWVGEWNHYTNSFSIETVQGNGQQYVFLVITFDTPFNYMGEDIWISLTNTETTQLIDPFTYGFMSFTTTDASVGGRYLGGKYASQLIIGHWGMINTPDPPDWGWLYGADPNNYAVNWPPYNNISYRPAMKFGYPMMTVANTNLGNSSKINDTTYAMTAINVQTAVSGFPLKLTELTFNTTGTGAGVAINRARIYTSTTNNLANAQLIGTITNLTGNVVFTPATAVQLAEGDNYFFIVYEIPTTNKCGDMLGVNVVNYKVGQRVNAAVTGDLATHTVAVNTSRTVAVDYTRVTLYNNDDKNPRVCFKAGENHTFRIRGQVSGYITGIVNGFRWERSTNGTTWQVITGATDSVLTFAKDLNFRYYKGVVFGPAGCAPGGANNADSVIYHIAYEAPNTGITLSYTGGYSPDELEQLSSGAELTLSANLNAGVGVDSIAYTWQVRYRDPINHVWTPWVNELVLTSATTLPYKYDVTAATIPGDYEIRVSAASARTGGCADIVMSNTFTFSVKITDLKFDFVNQPEPKVTLCPSGTLNLMVSYYGIVVRGYWQKDGVPLQDTNNINNRFFTRSGLTFLDNGEYTYKVIAMVSDFNEATGEFVLVERPFVSAPCLLSINPRIELFDYPQTNNYANPGDMISLKVTSTYISNEYAHDPNYGYQWYKYVQGKGEVKLVDNKFFKGTRSNALVITDILSDTDSSAYTFNGDFYYIIITGPCNTITTRTRPIYLFPGDKLSVTQQLKNAVLCNVGDRAEFTATVDYAGNMNDLVYQWYLGGSPLSDGLSITGSKTNKLVIDPTDAADFDETIFCRVSLSTNPTVFANSNSVMITKKVLELVSKTPNVDTVKVKVADYLPELRITYNATPGSVCKVYGIFNGVAFPQPLWEFTATTLLNIADIPEGHLTDIEMFGFMIINDCGDTIKAEWYAQIVDDDGNVVENPNTVTEFTSLNSLSIAPNPVNDLVSISFNSDIETHTVIELTGLSGSSIATLSEGISVIGLNKLDFDLNNLGIATGTYLIRITTNRGTISKQFLFIK